MSNVVNLPCISRLDLPADRILDAAKAAELEGVVVIGYHKDGSEYFASSYADGSIPVWLMERSKKKLLEIGE